MLGSSTPDPKKMQINLTSFLASSRESYQMYGKATFWFGALLSLAEEYDRKQL
jgi:hypothetical protein